MPTLLEVQHYIWLRYWIPDTRTMLDYLKAFPFMVSREGKQVFASNGELKRWFERGSVEVNGKKVKLSDPWPAVCDSVIIHPNGRNRTTLQ